MSVILFTFLIYFNCKYHIFDFSFIYLFISFYFVTEFLIFIYHEGVKFVYTPKVCKSEGTFC